MPSLLQVPRLVCLDGSVAFDLADIIHDWLNFLLHGIAHGAVR